MSLKKYISGGVPQETMSFQSQLTPADFQAILFEKLSMALFNTKVKTMCGDLDKRLLRIEGVFGYQYYEPEIQALTSLYKNHFPLALDKSPYRLRAVVVASYALIHKSTEDDMFCLSDIAPLARVEFELVTRCERELFQIVLGTHKLELLGPLTLFEHKRRLEIALTDRFDT